MTALTPAEQSFRRDLAESRSILRRWALGLTRNAERADDLVQDTLERALRFEHSYEVGSNLHGWLHRIMHNVFMSRCRRRGIERRVLGQLALAEQQRNQLEPRQSWLSPRVERALQNLPERIENVVRLVDLQDLSYGDAAGILEVPVGTVMSRLHRGRKRLAATLRDREAPQGAARVECAA